MYFVKELLVSSSYKKDEVLAEYTTPGTYTLEVKSNGVYEIEAVSAGAGGNQYDTGHAVWYSNCGATGAYYKGLIALQKGQYTCIIGEGSAGALGYPTNNGGSTSVGEVFVLSGGGGTGLMSGSPGGSITTIVGEKDRTIYTEGYPSNIFATSTYPIGRSNISSPAANYDLNNYGQGGGCYFDGYNVGGYNGTGGYLKITYKCLI